MKAVSRQTIILEALQNDARNGGVGLSVSEIAKIVFGNFHKSTADFHEKKISSYMGQVCVLAAENNIIVFAVKVATNKKTPEIKSRIARWRVFVPGQIGVYEEFIDALIYKKKCGESHTKSFEKMFLMAKSTGILTGEKIKELEN